MNCTCVYIYAPQAPKGSPQGPKGGPQGPMGAHAAHWRRSGNPPPILLCIMVEGCPMATVDKQITMVGQEACTRLAGGRRMAYGQAEGGWCWPPGGQRRPEAANNCPAAGRQKTASNKRTAKSVWAMSNL